jgi:hypothetical protein
MVLWDMGCSGTKERCVLDIHSERALEGSSTNRSKNLNVMELMGCAV